MRKTVYLDSTIPSYLFDQRDSLRDLIQITKDWWENERKHFRIVISDATIIEVGAGNHPYRDRILKECVSGLELLPPHDRLQEIVRVYVENHLMPGGATGDAVHLAYASFYKIDFLLTWNCRHIANAALRGRIEATCQEYGYTAPVLCTPEELSSEEGDDG